MKIKTIRNASGLTQEAFARKYNIPKRTLEGGRREKETRRSMSFYYSIE